MTAETQDWFFTFGFDHTHPDTGDSLGKSYVRIYGTFSSARAEMNAAFGNRWASQYSAALKPLNVDRYGLVEVPMPGAVGLGSTPVVTEGSGVPEVEQDDEALREVYAQDALDQDRSPTEDGFTAWKAARRAVGQGVPLNTQAEVVSEVQRAVLDEVSKLRETVVNKRGAHLTYVGTDELVERLDRIAQLAGGGQR